MTRLPRTTPLVLLIACAWGVSPVALSAEEPMKVDLMQDLHWQDHHFAMTNWFYKYQFGNPELQIKLLKERGYGGVMLSLKDDLGRWKMLPRYLAALKEHDMRLTATFDGGQPPISATGQTDATGRFQLGTLDTADGVPAGHYRVTVATAQEFLSSASVPMVDHMFRDPERSSLAFTVEPRANEFDIVVERVQEGAAQP